MYADFGGFFFTVHNSGLFGNVMTPVEKVLWL